MTVLERSELEASPLADLHTIANQIGIDGYRRLRKAELVDAILRVEENPGGDDREEGAASSVDDREEGAASSVDDREGGAASSVDDREGGAASSVDDREGGAASSVDDREGGAASSVDDREGGAASSVDDREGGGQPRAHDREHEQAGEPSSDDREEGDDALANDRAGRSAARTRRRRFGRLRRTAEPGEGEAGEQPVAGPGAGEGHAVLGSEPESETEMSTGAEPGAPVEVPPQDPRAARDAEAQAEEAPLAAADAEAQAKGSAAAADAEAQAQVPPATAEAELVEGTVELLSNGSAFLRVDPSGTSDKDVYVSAAQVRRCELVPGDRVAGPVRRPRRSERYPSLVRVQTINGIPASEIAAGPRYEELVAAFPHERLRLDSDDANLRAIDWLTPIGLGSRAVIVGPSGAGKTETLQRLLWTLADTDQLELSLVLVGIRPEEAADWRAGAVEPAAVLSFAAPQDAQAQAVEGAIETAKRVAARGGNALVAIDTLDGLAPAAARKAMAAARNLSAAGSLTVIATARASLGGETTVIALDPTLTATGRLPALDLAHSATMRPELLVGEDGAHAIREARVAAVTG